MTPDESLFALLDSLRIETHTIAHAPMRTVEDSREFRGELPGGHTKNLFLKDKKGGYWLLVALEDSAVNLNDLSRRLGTPRFSFGNAEDLLRLLGVVPGSVTPFGLINDVDGKVSLLLDEKMMAEDPLNFHPLRNDRTTTIATADFRRFLTAIGHEGREVALNADPV
jgi:Ala-tRNA(Pro) deacylase